MLGSLMLLGPLAGGCLLTTTLDGLSGGADVGSGEASAGDSSGDAGTAGDAANAEGGAGEFRCAMLSPAPAFCTDFDVGTLGSIIESSTEVGCSATLDDTLFSSTHRSLKLASPNLRSGTGRATVGRQFNFIPQSFIGVQFDLHVDSVDKTAAKVVGIDMGGYILALTVGDNAKIREGVPGGDGGPVFSVTDRLPPAAGRWVRVAFIVSIVDSGSHVVLSYDGVAQSAVPLVIHRYRASGWAVNVGINFVIAPDEGRDIHIDNLVIDGK